KIRANLYLTPRIWASSRAAEPGWGALLGSLVSGPPARGEAVASQEPKPPKPSSPAPGAPLPRGRHDIPAEEVERHQRDRVVAAVATVMAEHGYGGLTV